MARNADGDAPIGKHTTLCLMVDCFCLLVGVQRDQGKNMANS